MQLSHSIANVSCWLTKGNSLSLQIFAIQYESVEMITVRQILQPGKKHYVLPTLTLISEENGLRVNVVYC